MLMHGDKVPFACYSSLPITRENKKIFQVPMSLNTLSAKQSQAIAAGSIVPVLIRRELFRWRNSSSVLESLDRINAFILVLSK